MGTPEELVRQRAIQEDIVYVAAQLLTGQVVTPPRPPENTTLQDHIEFYRNLGKAPMHFGATM